MSGSHTSQDLPSTLPQHPSFPIFTAAFSAHLGRREARDVSTCSHLSTQDGPSLGTWIALGHGTWCRRGGHRPGPHPPTVHLPRKNPFPRNQSSHIRGFETTAHSLGSLCTGDLTSQTCF